MLSQEQVETFHRDGYLNGGEMLTSSEVEELSNALEEVIRKGPNGFGDGEKRPVLFRDLNASADYQSQGKRSDRPVWQIVNVWEASPPFERLIRHPGIVKAVSQLTGFGDLQVWHDQVQYKPPLAGGATTWHQDAPLWPAIEPMTPVSAWIPLDDADVENGCMWMVPGSHQWGNQRAYFDSIRSLQTLEEFTRFPPFSAPPEARNVRLEARPCPVTRRSVHFHHSMTWHGSPTNRSPRPRRAVAIHYMTSEARFTGRDHVMKQFITLKPGEPMAGAGPHFPQVSRGGEPLALRR